MKSNEHNRPVTLEDLLRLKRAEKPSSTFWTRFESELRAKQLAAIVEKNPWWRRLLGEVVPRHRFSLSATAILAVTVFVVRSNDLAPPESPPAKAMALATSLGASVDRLGAVLREQSSAFSDDLTVESGFAAFSAGSIAASAADPEAREPAAVLLAKEETSHGISRSEAWSADDELEPSALSPRAQTIANNLAVVKEAHPELSDRFFAASGFDLMGVMPSRQVIDPLSQMRSPSDINRELALASARFVASTKLARNSERVARRISDERLTEEAIRRFGARGNELSVKF
ncbi:MAG: hypothetical protein ABIZ81_05190 [Opitutaceae bacterium]